MTSFSWMIVFLIARYLHIVCTTPLVGGTLFYEMVVPVAIGELREEQQLLIFARARWVFKWLVWSSALALVASGIVGAIAHWPQYTAQSYSQIEPPTTQGEGVEISPAGNPGWWWAAHASTGMMALLISLSLTIGKTPPSHPIRWMRLNLIALLLVIFLATATRQARIRAEERRMEPSAQLEMRE
jgi:hypothetical protein